MGEDERALRAFIDALLRWTEESIDSGRFAADEASDLRMYAVILKGMTEFILDQTAERDQAANRLHRLMGAAMFLCSRVTTSESAVKFLNTERTDPGRIKAAENREPENERIRQAIAEAEKIYPPDRHGNKKRIAKKAGIDPRTVSRHRKKKRTP